MRKSTSPLAGRESLLREFEQVFVVGEEDDLGAAGKSGQGGKGGGGSGVVEAA